MKRFFDVVIAALCILILSPIYFILAILIKLESKGPVLFIQERVGRNEEPFFIYKFRSMVVHTYAPEELGQIKHNHALVTRVGHFMRRTKLDEIPQFFNVLFGDMSIVGPRPCLIESVKKMTAFERMRFKLSPGVTGWAEVTGNVELSWQEQLMLDVWYINHRSFWLDLSIMFRTLLTVMVGSVRNRKALLQATQYQQLALNLTNGNLPPLKKGD